MYLKLLGSLNTFFSDPHNLFQCVCTEESARQFLLKFQQVIVRYFFSIAFMVQMVTRYVFHLVICW